MIQFAARKLGMQESSRLKDFLPVAADNHLFYNISFFLMPQ
jgi:hypothetical protein